MNFLFHLQVRTFQQVSQFKSQLVFSPLEFFVAKFQLSAFHLALFFHHLEEPNLLSVRLPFVSELFVFFATGAFLPLNYTAV